MSDFDWLGDWKPTKHRDALGILDDAATGRDERLVLRRERSMADGGVFAFFRGAAGVMAADLGPEKHRVTGPEVDLVGDAHLGNFGQYGSPERSRVFDVNDFDEAARGPWEWDVCRLAASAIVLERDRGSAPEQQVDTARAAVTAYTDTAAALAASPLIDRWYTMTRCDGPICHDVAVKPKGSDEILRRVKKMLEANPKRTQAQTVAKFTKDGAFVEIPEKTAPIAGKRADKVLGVWEDYRDTIAPGLQRLLHGYTPTAVARVFAGQGSLGVRNFLLLVTGRRHDDAMILQIKEATPSQLGYGLELHIPHHEGQRVVKMQRALQAVSDPLLGWTAIGEERYYVRQYRDMKASPDLVDPKFRRRDRQAFARLCGTTLARAHSRTIEGDGITAIDNCIGDPRVFREAVVTFAATYAHVSRADQDALRARLDG